MGICEENPRDKEASVVCYFRNTLVIHRERQEEKIQIGK